MVPVKMALHGICSISILFGKCLFSIIFQVFTKDSWDEQELKDLKPRGCRGPALAGFIIDMTDLFVCKYLHANNSFLRISDN